MRLVYSVRTPGDVIYAGELGDDAVLTSTRQAPADWTGHEGHVDRELLAPLITADATIFICGSNGFVESASGLALECGADAARVRTERFGPSG